MTAPDRTSVSPVVLMTAFVLLVFATGTAEYLVAGILPDLARDMGITVALAGQSVTAYALGVAVGGPLLTLSTARVPRKGLAIALGVMFVLGIALTALAPTFPVLLVGRVISACSQATLFAIALITATQVMGPERSGRAVAIVASGLTVATTLGVPLGALMGASVGWRVPFAVVGAVAALAVLILAFTMPRTAAPTTQPLDELRSLVRAPVFLAIATTVVGFAGVSVVFTYIVPLLTGVTGLAPAMVPLLLLAYGLGSFVGNLVAGRLTDLSLPKTLMGVLLALVVVLGLFPFAAGTAASAVVATLLLGLLSAATIAPLQALILGHSQGAPTLALAVNVGAFNLANAVGSALGGVGVAAGALRWGGFNGAALALAGLVIAALALRASARHTPPREPTTEGRERT